EYRNGMAAIDESISCCDAGYAGANNGNVGHEEPPRSGMGRIGRSRPTPPSVAVGADVPFGGRSIASSGSLAIFAPIRLASSRVSNFAADRRPIFPALNSVFLNVRPR